MTATQYTWLFRNGLNKIKEELLAYATEDDMWVVRKEILNSTGNLAQHLVGNLKTFVGKHMGGFEYHRERDREFQERQFNRIQLLQMLEETAVLIECTLEGADHDFLSQPFPTEVVLIKEDQTFGFMLTHLYAHLQYHLGQINYHRRLL